MADRPLPFLEGYELLRLIGKGGMGQVYRGRRQSDGRDVAIKFILARAGSELPAKLVQRFMREMAVCKRFSHPNVVLILDGGLVPSGGALGGQPFLVMEYLEGTTLAEAPDFGAMGESRCLDLARQTATAFAYYHPMGLVHRDIKPSNIFLCPDSRLVLLDFGLVHADEMTVLTAEQETPGTLLTMAPEQLRGEELGPWTDIYQLGVSLFLSATGELPRTAEAVVQHALVGSPAEVGPLPEGYSRRFADFVNGCMALDVGERYEDAADLLRAVDVVAEGRGDVRPRRLRHGSERKVAAPAGRGSAALSLVSSPLQSGGRSRRPVTLLFLLLLLPVTVLLALFRVEGGRESSAGAGNVASLLDARDLQPLRHELLSRNEVADDGALQVLGEALVVGGPSAHRVRDLDPPRVPLALLDLARAAGAASATTQSLDYYEALVARFGPDVLEPVAGPLWSEVRSVFLAEPDRLVDVLRRRAGAVAVEERPVAAVHLARALLERALSRDSEGDLTGRELQGYLELNVPPKPDCVEAASLVEPAVVARVRDGHEGLRWFVYFDALHAIATEDAKDRGLRALTLLVGDDPASFVEGHCDVAVRALSLLGSRMRVLELDRVRRRCSAAAGLVGSLVGACRDEGRRAVLTTLQCWVVARSGDSEGAEACIRAIQPWALPRDERWRWYWALGKVLEDRGPRSSAAPVYREGLGVSSDERVQYFFRRRMNEASLEDVFGLGRRGGSQPAVRARTGEAGPR